MSTATWQCAIKGCTRPGPVYVGFSEWGLGGRYFCTLHKPTPEQAMRRGIVMSMWIVHGYYPEEIAAQLTSITGSNVRLSTVQADLRWLGLDESKRNAEARLSFELPAGVSVRDTNVVPLRRAR